MTNSLLGITRGYTGGGMVPPYQYRGGGTVGSTDTVPAMLTPGEVVLNAGQQQRLGAMTGVPSDALFNAVGVPGFQGGGVVPEFAVAEPVSTAHDAMDNLMMQNEMDKMVREDAMYGTMRAYDPYSDPLSSEFGSEMIEAMAGGLPMKGLNILGSLVKPPKFKGAGDWKFGPKGTLMDWLNKELLSEAETHAGVAKMAKSELKNIKSILKDSPPGSQMYDMAKNDLVALGDFVNEAGKKGMNLRSLIRAMEQYGSTGTAHPINIKQFRQFEQ